MSNFEKKPSLKPEAAHYPDRDSYSITRRRFLGIAGAGATAVALGAAAAGCGEVGLYEGRLPAVDSRSAFTSDWGDLGYFIRTQHSYQRFSQYLELFEEEILKVCDSVFVSRFSVDDLSDEAGTSRAEEELTVALEDDYRSRGQGSAGICDLELEIVRLQKTDGPDGMAGNLISRI